MKLTTPELDLLLDIISTHLVRHEDGQDLSLIHISEPTRPY